MILANLNLLFWLSLIPFATGWMGENHFAANTIAVYGIILWLAGLAFFILQKTVERNSHDIAALKKAFLTLNKKGVVSQAGYLASVPLAYIHPAISGVLYLILAVVWLIPDKNIEKALREKQ